jgi:aminopeptidase
MADREKSSFSIKIFLKGVLMTDQRVARLAKVLVQYSMGIQPGWKMINSTTPLGEELALAVYVEALKAGAHVINEIELPGAEEAFYKYSSDDQLDWISPARRLIIETFDASLFIEAPDNTRSLSGIAPGRMARTRKSHAAISRLFLERAVRGEMHWCITAFPTQAAAQEADMSLADYQDFVYKAELVDLDNPVAAWQAEREHQLKAVNWLAGKDKVVLRGDNIDLSFSIKRRTFEPCAGECNFPDGEIFTGPVEDSAEGWVRFRYPAIYEGQEVTDVELRFENGRCVQEKASKGQGLLTTLLDSDAGARCLGEWGIGTNYGIQRFTKNMLFDEKMGGTIHLALGAGYPETGSVNDSGIHWDMLCDMAQSEVRVDGELFYKDGKILVGG